MEIEVDNLVFGYGESPILDGISFKIEKPQLVSVIGPNGVGKSTLIQCINRILEIDSGTIALRGKPLEDYSQKELAKIIGYVPCMSWTSFPMSVVDTVLMGRFPHSGNRRTDEDLRKVYSVLNLLGISDLALRPFNELSAGQHQKVMLARGLAQESKILLLDEPTANLDIKHQMGVTRILKELAHRKDITIIMICHDLNIASRYSDRIMMLHDGSIYADGTPEEVITKENIFAVYGVESDIVTYDGRPHVMIRDTGDVELNFGND